MISLEQQKKQNDLVLPEQIRPIYPTPDLSTTRQNCACNRTVMGGLLPSTVIIGFAFSGPNPTITARCPALLVTGDIFLRHP
ncbi:hypothetical protein A2U01_0066732, partial [Trifolium medium]|nr:hypothetical protein [Trifolium medium]